MILSLQKQHKRDGSAESSLPRETINKLFHSPSSTPPIPDLSLPNLLKAAEEQPPAPSHQPTDDDHSRPDDHHPHCLPQRQHEQRWDGRDEEEEEREERDGVEEGPEG